MKFRFVVFFSVFTIFLLPLYSQTRIKCFEINEKQASINFHQNENTECAVIHIHSPIKELNFESNMGKIKEQEQNVLDSLYLIYVYPVKQKIFVKSIGFMESELGLFNNLSPGQQFYYEISEAVEIQGRGNLILESDPPGADIFIDGIPSINLKTTCSIPNLAATQYEITVKKQNYQDSTFIVNILPNKENSVMVQLKPIIGTFIATLEPGSHKALVCIKSTMNPFEAYINGKVDDDLSNGKEILLPSQDYQLRVVYIGNKSWGYSAYEEKIKLSNGEKLVIHPLFKSNLVMMDFHSNLPYVKLTIFDSNNKIKYYDDILSGPIELIPGELHAIASKPGYINYYMTIDPSQRQTQEILLYPEKALNLLTTDATMAKPQRLSVRSLSDQETLLGWDKMEKIDAYIIDSRQPQGNWLGGFLTLSPTCTKWTDQRNSGCNEYRIYTIFKQCVSKSTSGKQIPVPKMVFVEGGNFLMGCKDGLVNEKPLHHVKLSSFNISKFEVTQAEYQSVMGSNPSHDQSDSDYPVENVGWFEAIEYCNRLSMHDGLNPCYSYDLYDSNPDNWPPGWNRSDHMKIHYDGNANGYRLPTEAEWEFAAKGGNLRKDFKYSGSNEVNPVAWDETNSDKKYHSIGTKAPNELGLFDMSGNLWEWCWDVFGSYSTDTKQNPRGAEIGRNRVIRGGSWNNSAVSCRITYRDSNSPYGSANNGGIRLCRKAD